MTDKVNEARSGVAGSMEDIVGSDDIEYAEVPGFKAGQMLRIGSLTAGDLIEWSEANEGEAKRTAGLRLVTKSLVNEVGERYAQDPKNIAVFRTKSHKATKQLVEAILKLNGMELKKDDAAKKE